VLGHILPVLGKDWAQSGVAQLFTKIKNNGYRLLYLSARAIGQARVTREYLKSIKQGNLSLPEGPLLLNPTSLISALHREVIEKKPEEFKISCLRDIQALFPHDYKPFYAGYGNKINVKHLLVLNLNKSNFFGFTGCLGLSRCWHSNFPNFHYQPPRGAETRADSDIPVLVSTDFFLGWGTRFEL
jgi:phosphatidate phosphatase PAH1